jgi:hypothetical protein
MVKKQKYISKTTAEEIVREFCEDVKAAFGTGKGDKIDSEELNWFDLEVTYERAVKYLKDHTN